MTKDWSDYYKTTKGRPPKPLLAEALTHVAKKGAAIDIGAGALNESLFLLEQGFEVTAIDKSPLIADQAQAIANSKLHAFNVAAELFDFPVETYDLACAMFSLPFIAPQSFDGTFNKIRSSIKKGGVFCGQLFGIRDAWADKPDMTFHTREQAEQLFRGFELISLKEVENDGPTAAGSTKHWHVFHVIARKRS